MNENEAPIDRWRSCRSPIYRTYVEALAARVLGAFEKRTGLSVVVNTNLNATRRPIVDDPRDALECCGSAPVDALAMGPFLVRRPAWGRSAP